MFLKFVKHGRPEGENMDVHFILTEIRTIERRTLDSFVRLRNNVTFIFTSTPTVSGSGHEICVDGVWRG